MNNEDRVIIGNYLRELFLEARTLLDYTDVRPGSAHYIVSLQRTLDEMWSAVCVLLGPYPENPEPVPQENIVPLTAEGPEVTLVTRMGSGRARGRQSASVTEPVPVVTEPVPVVTEPVPVPEPVPPGRLTTSTGRDYRFPMVLHGAMTAGRGRNYIPDFPPSYEEAMGLEPRDLSAAAIDSIEDTECESDESPLEALDPDTDE